MNWDEFAKAAPELAVLGLERFEKTGVCLIGTLRKDGSPRISPIEPFIVRGELMLGMMWQSRKALDVVRDPRIVVHSAVSNRDGAEGDFKLYGRVRDVPDPALREAYATRCSRRSTGGPKSRTTCSPWTSSARGSSRSGTSSARCAGHRPAARSGSSTPTTERQGSVSASRCARTASSATATDGSRCNRSTKSERGIAQQRPAVFARTRALRIPGSVSNASSPKH